MEEHRESTQYWCHECNMLVIPILGVETVKCSSCNGEFVEEMDNNHHENNSDPDLDPDPDRAVSLWAPILLGMMNNPRRLRRFTHIEFEEAENDRHNAYRRYQFQNPRDEIDSDLDLDLQSAIQRQRRSSATIRHLLHGVRAGIVSESENNTEENNRERVILINPFNQTIVVQRGGGNPSQTHPIGSLGDYFSGPGLELLLQQLAENDPNRYGTPPAHKDAVKAMPTVIVEDRLAQCSVCLDDFEVGIEAKEMPCKHKFHSKCILPWLELHSSCPVCRFELPSDVAKLDQEQNNVGNSEDRDGRDTRRFPVSLLWPFTNLFSSSGPETGSLVTSASTSASGSNPGSTPRAHGEEDNQ